MIEIDGTEKVKYRRKKPTQKNTPKNIWRLFFSSKFELKKIICVKWVSEAKNNDDEFSTKRAEKICKKKMWAYLFFF